MKLVSVSNQQRRDFLYDASGSITTGGSAQLVLARSMSRSLLYFKNTSLGPMWIESDGPRATATITNGAVTGVTITNAGFNMTFPPLVRFFGGGSPNGGAGIQSSGVPNTSYLGLNQPNGPSPSNVATGLAVMTGSAPNKSVASVTITNPGSGYVIAPYVQLITSDLDPYGCAVPSTNVGWELGSGEAIMLDNSAVPTEAISVFGASTGQTFSCKWME